MRAEWGPRTASIDSPITRSPTPAITITRLGAASIGWPATTRSVTSVARPLCASWSGAAAEAACAVAVPAVTRPSSRVTPAMRVVASPRAALSVAVTPTAVSAAITEAIAGSGWVA